VSVADRIIVALDCQEDEALLLAQQLRSKAKWLKVGMTLYYSTGPSIISTFKVMGFKVFLDLKLHDIPHQVQGAAASAVAAGADMLTVHASGGLAMMQAAALGAHQACEQKPGGGVSPVLLGVTVLTSMDETMLQELGINRSLTTQVASLAQLTLQAGFNGVVASPLEAPYLRKLLGENFVIVTPGVRPAQSATDDQSRIATPAQALQDGASYLVIGRPITAAKDPRLAFDAIVDEIVRKHHA